VLGLTPLAGVLEAQQFGQVLGVGAVELAAPIAARSGLVQEALGEAAMAVAKVEFQLDGGRSTVAPGLQFIHAAGAVALEEGARIAATTVLAGFVGAGEQVEAGLQRRFRAAGGTAGTARRAGG
jgi:hypothetical protein